MTTQLSIGAESLGDQALRIGALESFRGTRLKGFKGYVTSHMGLGDWLYVLPPTCVSASGTCKIKSSNHVGIPFEEPSTFLEKMAGFTLRDVRPSDPHLVDDILFLIDRIDSLVETPAVPLTFRNIPVSKSGLSRAHDLSVPLPAAWGEYSSRWCIPTHWDAATGELFNAKPVPKQKNLVLHLTKKHQPYDAWEKFCFENSYVEKRTPVKLIPKGDRSLLSIPSSVRCGVSDEYVPIDRYEEINEPIPTHETDPNLNNDLRMSTYQTKGVFPQVRMGAAIWHPVSVEAGKLDRVPSAFEHPYIPELDEDFKFDREESEQVILANIERLDEPVYVTPTIPRPDIDTTNTDPAYWESVLRADIEWADECRELQARKLWGESFAEATEQRRRELTGEPDAEGNLDAKKQFIRLFAKTSDIFAEIYGLKFRFQADSEESEDFEESVELEFEPQTPVDFDSLERNGYTEGQSDDEDTRDTRWDGINYEGVRETTQGNTHEELKTLRKGMNAKYLMGIGHLTREEQIARIKKHKNFGWDIRRYVMTFDNVGLTDMQHKHSYAASKQAMYRADQRTDESLALSDFSDFPSDLPKLTRVMTNAEIHESLCPGGFFIVVSLNDKLELKRLGDLSMTEDECEQALECAKDESVRKAINYARGKAAKDGLGKRATAECIRLAGERIIEAYDRVLVIDRVEVCKAHVVEP